MSWRPIGTAPKDGTFVLLFRDGWLIAPVAYWSEYPCNPVIGDSHEDVWMYGWLFRDKYCHIGIEEGFLGWKEDVTPTHWMPLPTPPDDL